MKKKTSAYRPLDEKLPQALEASEKAYRELAVLAYSAAHDLRAPVRSIVGFSQILLETHTGNLNEEGQLYLRRIKAAGQTMSLLIEASMKLVSLAHADIRREDVDLSALAESIAADLRRIEPARQVDIKVQPGMRATRDPDLLAELLENLLGNAWKFTSRHEGGRIEFGTAVREGEASFFVRDDGAGFEPLSASKLFVPFQRLHSERQFPGVGAGLAIVRNIARLHGGRVAADGAVEKGATIYLTVGRPPGAA